MCREAWVSLQDVYDRQEWVYVDFDGQINSEQPSAR